MIGHIAPVTSTHNGVTGQLYDRQTELELALFDCLQVLHRTNLPKKEIADKGRKLLGYRPGQRLPREHKIVG